MNEIADAAYESAFLVWAVAGRALLPLLAVCGVLTLFHKTRLIGGVILWLFSWPVGLTTWLLGVAFTFGSFGWPGVIVGLVLFGIGVVPLGFIGAVWQGEPSAAGLLLTLGVGTYAIRIAGIWATGTQTANGGGRRWLTYGGCCC